MFHCHRFNYVQKERAIEQEAIKLRDFLSWTKADLHFDLLGSRKLSQIIFSHSYILPLLCFCSMTYLAKRAFKGLFRENSWTAESIGFKFHMVMGMATGYLHTKFEPHLMMHLVVITRTLNQKSIKNICSHSFFLSNTITSEPVDQ